MVTRPKNSPDVLRPPLSPPAIDPTNGNGVTSAPPDPAIIQPTIEEHFLADVPGDIPRQANGIPDARKLDWKDFVRSLSPEQYNNVWIYIYMHEPRQSGKIDDDGEYIFRLGGKLEPPVLIDEQWLVDGWVDPPTTALSRVRFLIWIKNRRAANHDYYKVIVTVRGDLKPASQWRGKTGATPGVAATATAGVATDTNTRALDMVEKSYDDLRAEVSQMRREGSRVDQQVLGSVIGVMSDAAKAAKEIGGNGGGSSKFENRLMEMLLEKAFNRDPIAEILKSQELLDRLRGDDKEEPGGIAGAAAGLASGNGWGAFIPLIGETIKGISQNLQTYLNVRSLELRIQAQNTINATAHDPQAAVMAPPSQTRPPSVETARVDAGSTIGGNGGTRDARFAQADYDQMAQATAPAATQVPPPGPPPSGYVKVDLDILIRLAVANAIDQGKSGTDCANIADAISEDEADKLVAILKPIDDAAKALAKATAAGDQAGVATATTAMMQAVGVLQADQILGRFVTHPGIEIVVADFCKFFEEGQ